MSLTSPAVDQVERRLVEEIQALYAIVRAVGSDLDLPTVLHTIAQAVCEHSPWKRCTITVVDETAGYVEAVAEYPSVPAEALRRWRVEVSSTVQVLRRRTPLAISDALLTTEYPGIQREARTTGFRGVLIFPLLVDDLPSAIWFYTDEPHEFTQPELHFAGAIADHVAVALRNARLYERQREATNRFERLLDTQTELIERVLGGESLVSLARVAARILGNPVVVLDRLQHCTAHALPESDRADAAEACTAFLDRLSDSSFARGLVAGSSTTSQSLVVPLSLGGHVHGYLVVPDLLRGFDALDTAVSQQVGLAMALVLAQEYIAFEAESRLKSDLLRKLFSGTWSDPQEVVARAAFLGIDLAVPNALLLLRADMPVGGGDGAHVAGRIPGDQVLAQVAAVLASHFPGVAAVRDEQEVVILVPTDGKPAEFARVVAGALVELLAPLAPPALVVVGPVSSSVAEYPRARAECRRAVSVCQTLGKSGVIELSDLGAHRFLLSEDNIGAMQQFLEDTLGAILAYERKRPTELISTLWAYFDNNCSLRDTAQALFIHVSTLRYRLERIETLSGLDLDDPETRFSLQLALRFHRLVESGIETAEPAVRRGAGSARLAVRRPTG